MTYETKVGKKHQIVIPLAIRQKKDIREGDSMIWDINEVTGQITIIVRPKDFVRYMRGMGKEMWRETDSDKYLDGERDTWK